jgi:hypothetical protein
LPPIHFETFELASIHIERRTQLCPGKARFP